MRIKFDVAALFFFKIYST